MVKEGIANNQYFPRTDALEAFRGELGSVVLDGPPAEDSVGQLVKLGIRKERGETSPEKVEVGHDCTSKK